MNFAAVVTPKSLSFVGPDGSTYTYQASMSQSTFDAACQLVRRIQKAWRDHENRDLVDQLITLISPSKIVARHGEGRVLVENGVVTFDGQPVHGAVTQNILWGLNQGFDMKPYMRFLEKLQDNPSRRAVTELYDFIDRHKLVLAEDGDFLAYKKVAHDFMDLFSHRFDNSPGNIVKTPRNTVDDDFGVQCSQGLHCCAFVYLPHYRSEPDNRVVMVKVNPKDVVSVPKDLDCAKLRVCEYVVLREIFYRENSSPDHLSQRPVWTEPDISGEEVEDWGESGEITVGDMVRYTGSNHPFLATYAVRKVAKIEKWSDVPYVQLEGDDSSRIYLLEEFEKVTGEEDSEGIVEIDSLE